MSVRFITPLTSEPALSPPLPTPADFPQLVADLVTTGRLLGARGWCPATGGNFSARIDSNYRLITQSGRDKARLSDADLLLCDAAGKALDPGSKPSDETALHMRLYQLDDGIGAVLHTHSVVATVLSRLTPGDALSIQGFEMQKALSVCSSHEQTLRLPIFANTQDIPALAEAVASTWQDQTPQVPGLLVRGHGLYAWGQDIAQAQRHVEGLEFLLDCLWQEQLLGRRPA